MQGELHPISGPWPGQLAILRRPRGHDWLTDEVRTWRRAGVDVVVSLLTNQETVELGLTEEHRAAADEGLRFISFPIADYSVPKSEESVIHLMRQLNELLSAGKHVGIHCRQGIGRSGLIAASLLVVVGEEPSEAFAHVAAGRGAMVPDTAAQREWVCNLAKNVDFQSPFSFAK